MFIILDIFYIYSIFAFASRIPQISLMFAFRTNYFSSYLIFYNAFL